MSCWSTTACAASGGTGFYHPGHPGLVLTTSDGGATWASTMMPAPQHGVPAIACVSGGACWAGGAGGGIVTNFLPTAKGYWMVGRDGGAFAFGAAGYLGLAARARHPRHQRGGHRPDRGRQRLLDERLRRRGLRLR